jgi:hypothetical protein
VAFLVQDGRITSCGDSPLTVYFPTQKETFLGFLTQGPYRTTPARDNVPEQDPSNQELARRTGALVVEVLRELRRDGVLTGEVLATMPVDAGRFGEGTLLWPVFEAVREVLAAEEVIPVSGGGYATAERVFLTKSTALRELVGGGIPGPFGINKSFEFVSESVTEGLWHYFSDEIGIRELTVEGFAAGLSGEFLAGQPDGWIARLYGFLAGYPSLWRGLGAVIRLEDGSQVAAFDGGDRPAVYLPGGGASSLPTVRRAVAEVPEARRFLEALGLTEPDVVAEVLEVVLPRYLGLDVAQLDLAQHDVDLDCVLRALDEAPGGRRQELLERLQATPFLIGENAGTGEQRLMPPVELYQRSKELEAYFDGNPDAWFAGDGYGPWLVQLRAMGVRQGVAVRARAANSLGYVVLAVEFGRNERGVDGFDPAAEIDGLEFALGRPDHGRSEYVWNALLAPNRRLVTGVVERSVLASFSDSSLEQVRSAIAVAAEREAWLPGRDGTFRRPGELSLDDLPPTYARDEGLAQALGMQQPVVGEAARRLGVPAEVLWGLSEHPELVGLVREWLATARAGRGGAGGAGEEAAG